MSKRLSSKGSKLHGMDVNELSGHATVLDVWSLPSMGAAVATRTRQQQLMPHIGTKLERDRAGSQEALVGNAARLAAAEADSEDLVAEAIKADPRLARRNEWRRGEEGDIVCPALLSQGDDTPFFYRRRAQAGQPNGTEPARIVISTDSATIKPGTAAAFIAACRLVQQFRPIEVFWQGSWLGGNRNVGWVFHVPLVSGDVDFSRLEFCIASPYRDNLSWSVMMTRACDVTKAIYNACNLQAERSYLPDAKFVSHHGVEPNGYGVAAAAADWLGWESSYESRWNQRCEAEAALMSLPIAPTAYKPMTSEERAASLALTQSYLLEKQNRDATAAANRAAELTSLNRTF